MTDAQFEKFYRTELLDGRSFSWEKSPPVYMAGGSGALVSVSFVDRDGGSRSLGQGIYAEDGGAGVFGLPLVTVFANAGLEGREKRLPQDGTSRLRHVQDYISRNADRLEREYGMRGLVYQGDEGFLTWEEVQKRIDRQLAGTSPRRMQESSGVGQ